MNTGTVVGAPALLHRLTFVAALGGLLFGYDTAVISGALGSIEARFIAPLQLGETAHNAVSGFVVSSTLFGCIGGALLAGWLSARFGRKAGMVVAALLFLISALGSAVPEAGLTAAAQAGAGPLVSLIGYRAVCGIGVGIITMLAPLYIAEIAPPERRGHLVSWYQLAIVLGFVSAYFANWQIAAQGNESWLNDVGWRYMLGSGALPALLLLSLLPSVPDTPRGLLLRGRSEQAYAVLGKLFPERDARRTFEEIVTSLDAADPRVLAFGAKVLLIGILICVFQQLVGINIVLYYSPLMFKNMGASTDTALLQTAILGAINMGFTFVAMFKVDTWGRKPLLIVGGLIMAASMLALGTLFATGHMGFAALLAACVYLAAFTFSWGPVTPILLAEIFPNAIKSKALTLATALQWLTNLFVSWTFRILDGSSALNAVFNHGFAYLLYGLMSLLAVIFVIRWVPETKGKPLEAIQRLWQRPRDGDRLSASLQ